MGVGACALTGINTMKKLTKIGVQLYTVREDMKKDFEGTLAKVASIGYQEVEFAGYYNRTPKQVRDLLDSNRLSAPASHIPLETLRKDIAGSIEAAKTIGLRYIICPWLDPAERRSLDDYKRHADFFNRTGEACQKAGLQFGYHNHDFEFTQLEGEMPYDVLLKGTDPKLVKMELDLYWITRAGQDPLAYFERQPARFELVHVKDMARTPDRAPVEVGRGTIDFKTIFARAERAGVKHFLVEQDEPKSGLDSIKESLEYLRRLEW